MRTYPARTSVRRLALPLLAAIAVGSAVPGLARAEDAVGTDAAVTQVAVGLNPLGLAVTPDGSELWVANVDGADADVKGDGTISVVDTATNTVTATIALGGWPTEIAFTPDGTTAYVPDTGGRTRIIDVATRTETGTIEGGDFPVAIALDAAAGRAWVANRGYEASATSVSVLDLAAGTIAGQLTVGLRPLDVALSPDGTVLAVPGADDGSVTLLDAASGEPTATVEVGGRPGSVAFSADGTQLFVTGMESGALTAIDVATASVAASAVLGAPLNGIALLPGGTQLAIAHGTEAAGELLVVDAATLTVVTRVAVGANAQRTAVGAVPGVLYASDFGDASVSVVVFPAAG
ncbi:MAG: hypothetical protein ACKOTZ_10945 [Chloroflexota bacterium]